MADETKQTTNSIFECEVPEKNLKVLAAAFACLLKLGQEVIFSVSNQDGVTLTVLSETMTVFMTIKLSRDIFQAFHLAPVQGSEGSAQQDMLLSFKLLLKPCARTFKTVRGVSKLYMTFRDTDISSELTCCHECTSGVFKSNTFHAERCDMLDATFTPNPETCSSFACAITQFVRLDSICAQL